MPNSYYNHGANPASGAFGSSSVIRTELDNITTGFTTVETAINLKAPIASPTLTGDPKAPTPPAGDNDTSIATTAFAMGMTSPAFIGVPTAPTAAPGASTTQIATTAFVRTEFAPLASPTFTGSVTVTSPSTDLNPATKLYVDTSVGQATPVPPWASGATYVLGQVVWSLINFQSYRHITATSSLTVDPAADGVNWVVLGATTDLFNLSVGII